MRVLVTGGTGFTGTALVRRLLGASTLHRSGRRRAQATLVSRPRLLVATRRILL